MPSDLDQLAQDADHRDRWGTPPTGNGLQDAATRAAQQSMTHQPEQPNPSAPYLQRARDIGQRMFVDPLKTTGFLPQDQTPPWFNQAQQFGGRLFREGPAPMIAGMFPRGGLAQVAAQSGYMPQWMNDNVLTHALRSPEFTQATQFFTPLIGALTLASVPNTESIAFPGRKFQLIHRETGEQRGDVWLNYNDATKNVSVEYFQSKPRTGVSALNTSITSGERRWGLGNNPIEAALELRSALPEVFREFPDMKTVSFTSVGGTRGAQNIAADLQYEVTRTPEGVEWKRVKHIPDLWGRRELSQPQTPSPQRFPIPTQSFPPGTGPSQRPITPPPPMPRQPMTRAESRTLLDHLLSQLERGRR